jgi:thiamine biosynthesis lipoprotein
MNRWRTLQFDFVAMASPCCVQLDGQDEQAMTLAAIQAMAEVRRIERQFSRYRDDNVMARIHQAAGQAWVDVDDETDALLDFSGQLWAQSDGFFDVTSGVLRQAWDFKAGRLPEAEHLQSLLNRVGWQRVERRKGQVRLQAGMELDFGGFGKEYAADRAAAVLHSHGFQHALVNLGGDLHALGPRGLPELDGQAWHIDIQHPRPPASGKAQPWLRIPLTQGGLATSGDYERFLIHNGQRHCHVLNPTTGWPVGHWQSVSVVAANTTTAGVLSTVAMLKEAQATEWLDAQHATYAAVNQQGELIRSGLP